MGCAHIFLTDSLSFKFSIFTALTPLKYRQQKKQNICKLAVYIYLIKCILFILLEKICTLFNIRYNIQIKIFGNSQSSFTSIISMINIKFVAIFQNFSDNVG